MAQAMHKQCHKHCTSNTSAIANVKRNVNVKERKALSNTNTKEASSFSSSVRSLMFNEALINIIQRKICNEIVFCL